MRAGIHAARHIPAVVEQMRAARALLGQLQLLVPIHRPQRAGIHQVLTAGSLLGIDDDQAVIAAIDRTIGRTKLEHRALLAVLAHDGLVGNAHPWHLAAVLLEQMHPEMPRIGLRRRIGTPIVFAMLVFADDLAVVAAVALLDVNKENLSHDFLRFSKCVKGPDPFTHFP